MFYDGDTAAVEHESLLDFSRTELCNVSHCHLASADTSKADAGNGSDRQAGKGRVKVGGGCSTEAG